MTTVPVVTLMGRQAWDRGFLDALLDGSVWQAPGGCTYERVADWPDNPEGAVVVVPAQYHVDEIDSLNERLGRMQWCLVVLTFNERHLWPHDALHHPNMRLWVQSPDLDRDYGDARIFPVGWPPLTRERLRSYKVEKSETWFFSGQVICTDRENALEAMSKRSDGVAIRTGGYAQGMAQDEYLRRLAAAKIAPCPDAHHTQPDSFRVWEALEAGCVPIVHRGPYWSRVLFGLTPSEAGWGEVDDWRSDFDTTLSELLATWPRCAERAAAVWEDQKRRWACALEDDVRHLRGER